MFFHCGFCFTVLIVYVWPLWSCEWGCIAVFTCGYGVEGSLYRLINIMIPCLMSCSLFLPYSIVIPSNVIPPNVNFGIIILLQCLIRLARLTCLIRSMCRMCRMFKMTRLDEPTEASSEKQRTRSCVTGEIIEWINDFGFDIPTFKRCIV